MGPRSEDRGNSVGSKGTQRRGKASMGPRSEDRGNPPTITTAPIRPSMLQWGRDLKIAEMDEPMTPPMTPRRASMGPRSEDRGNPAEVA